VVIDFLFSSIQAVEDGAVDLIGIVNDLFTHMLVMEARIIQFPPPFPFGVGMVNLHRLGES
jgi:hypothetical protein